MLKMQSSALETPTFVTENPSLAFSWQSLSHQIAYVPHGQSIPTTFPTFFSTLQLTDMAEVDVGDQTYLLNKQINDTGTLYIARNITAFEERENKFNLLLIVLVLVIGLLSWWLARLSSQTITTPLEKLSQTIQQLPIGPYLPPLKTAYQDQELYDIAITFNRFLNEINAYMRREKYLLHLASHELRTPIAVITGAIEIIESRGMLNDSDAITMQRLKRANSEMAINIATILRLARATEQTEKTQIALDELIEQVQREMAEVGANTQRIQILQSDAPLLYANKPLVKMLLRNLLQNALQHTSGTIYLRLQKDKLLIQDEGNGLSHEQQQRLRLKSPPTTGGLGLYIVTMICEKLLWQLSWQSEPNQGTLIVVHYHTESPTPF